MSDETPTGPRPGSSMDLSRRMERVEVMYETLSREVGTLTGTVGRVELNQKHAEDLNKYRFAAIETSVNQLTSKLTEFMTRIDGIVSGEIQTAQQRAGLAMVAEYNEWRDKTNSRLEKEETLSIQTRLMARLLIFATGGSLVGTAFVIWQVFFKP